MPRLISILALLLVAIPATAATTLLPLDRPLDAVDTLTLQLDQAEIEVEITRVDSPSLRVASLSRERDGSPRAASVELVATAAGVTLSRAAPDGGRPPARLGVTVRLRPTQSLSVTGSDVSVTVADSQLPEAGESTTPSARRRTREDESADGQVRTTDGSRAGESGTVSITVQGGQVDLLGVRSPTVTADDAWVRFDQTAHVAELTLNRSTFEAERHAGALDVLSTDSEVRVSRLAGVFRFDGLGGALTLVDGRGTLEVKSEDTTTSIAEWRGGVTVTARGASTELRATRGTGGPLQLSFYDAQVVLDDVAGVGRLALEGGRLEARDCAMELEGLVARGAVEWTGGRRSLTLVIVDGEISLRRHASEAKLQTERSTVALDGVALLTLRAQDSRIEGGGVDSIGSFQVSGGEVDLRLPTLEAKPVGLSFQAEAEVSLFLPSPCVVQVRTTEPLDSESVKVSGCDLRTAGQPMRSARQRAQYGRRPLQVTLTVEPDVSLEIEGGS